MHVWTLIRVHCLLSLLWVEGDFDFMPPAGSMLIHILLPGSTLPPLSLFLVPTAAEMRVQTALSFIYLKLLL